MAPSDPAPTCSGWGPSPVSLLRVQRPSLAKNCHAKHECKIVEVGCLPKFVSSWFWSQKCIVTAPDPAGKLTMASP